MSFIVWLCFALGIWLAIRLIAALHAIADLWFMIGKVWITVACEVLGWGTITWGAALWLSPPNRIPLLMGWLAYLAFYLSVAELRYLALYAARKYRTRIG